MISSYHVLHDSKGRWSESLTVSHFDDLWRILSDNKKGDIIHKVTISKDNAFNCTHHYLTVDHPNGQLNEAAKGNS